MARNLTIRLLKEGRDFDDCLNTDKYTLTPIELLRGLRFSGKVFVEQKPHMKPNWQDFVQTGISHHLNLHTASAKALLLLKVDQRIFAITFGRGSNFFLNQDAIVSDFGWKVALNTLDSNSLRSIDVKTIDDNVRDTRTQTSKSSGIGAFGIDVARDLLEAVTGKPKDPAIGKRVSGAEALAVCNDADFADLGGLCRRLLQEYAKEDYKEEFEWVDKLQPVNERTEPNLIAALNEKLLAAVKSDESVDKIYLAPPDIIDWQEANDFAYQPKYGREGNFNDPAIEDYLEGLRDLQNLTIEDTKAHRLLMNPDDDGTKLSWPIYQCFVFETRHEGPLYVLTGGKWFRVAQDYVTAVDQFITDMPLAEGLSLPDASAASQREDDYNRMAAEANPSVLALLDKSNIQCGRGQGRVEPCDLFTSTRQFVHVKRRGKSSSKVLSHLFAQGRVAIEAFLEHEPFRNTFKDRLPSTHKSLVSARPARSEYEVVYAIITGVQEEAWAMQLPFFSRLNLMQSVRFLTKIGVRSSLYRINIQ